MSNDNKQYNSNNNDDWFLAYCALIGFKFGIENSDWFSIFLAIIFIFIALSNVTYRNKNSYKSENSNYLLKYSKKKYPWTILNNYLKVIVYAISSTFFLILTPALGVWEIKFIVLGVIFTFFECRDIFYATDIRGFWKSKDPYTLLGYARTSINYKKFTESKEFLLKALEYDPNEVKFYSQMGFLYYDLGEQELGNNYYKMADELDPPDELYNDEGKLKRRKKT